MIYGLLFDFFRNCVIVLAARIGAGFMLRQ
jgi:hypothetical protein